MNFLTEQQKFEYNLKRNNREIKWFFTPAKEKNKPILFILHGQGHAVQCAQFKNPSFNVVCPMDSFGYEGLGS